MKTTSMFSCLLYLAVALLTACASYGNELSLPTVTSPPGTTVSLDVTIADATAIEAGDIIITYSAQALQIDSVALGQDTPSGWLLVANTGTPGRITASFMGTAPFSGDGTLLAISATVRADATLGETTDLAFSSASLSDTNGAVTTTTTDGSFQCIDPDPPAAVTGLFAVDTPNDDGGSITLSWTPSTDDGAGANDVTGYDLLRSETSGTEGFTVLAANLAPGTGGYTDDTAIDGADYWYIVRTKDITNQTDTPAFGPVAATIIQARIASPATGSWVHETIDILGTASCQAGFQSYHLQWAPGAEPLEAAYNAGFLGYFEDAVDDGVLLAGLDTSAVLTPDSDYSLRITASDTQNSTSSHTILLHVDNTTPEPPELAISAPFGQDVYVKNGDTISVAGNAEAWSAVHTAELLTADDSALQTVTSDLSTTQPGAISGSFAVADFGDTPAVRLRATVNDRSVNVSDATISNALTVDNTLPTVTITEPLDGATPDTEPIRIIGVCADDISYVVRVEVSADDGATWADAQLRENAYWHYDFTPPEPLIDYVIKARATDVAGNSRISDPITIHYAPELRIVNPGHDGHVPTSPIEISGIWTASQREVTIELSTDGGTTYNAVNQTSPGVWSHIFTPPNPMATYTLIARATDLDGHVVESLPSALQHYAFSSRPLAIIESPGKGADLANFPPSVTVVGTIAPFTEGNAATWTLDYQKTDEGDTWHELATGDQPVTRSTLAEWPHNHALPPGDYTLRLTVTSDGQTQVAQMPLTNTNAAPEPAHYPDPVNGAREVPTSGTTLRWQGKRAATHKVIIMKWPVPE